MNMYFTTATKALCVFLFVAILVGCHPIKQFFLSRIDRCGLIKFGELTQAYSVASIDSEKKYLITAGETCIVIEVEDKKSMPWFHISCEGRGLAWVRFNMVNRAYFGEE